jgi:hypothetical protein
MASPSSVPAVPAPAKKGILVSKLSVGAAGHSSGSLHDQGHCPHRNLILTGDAKLPVKCRECKAEWTEIGETWL